jgi:hypothetical protein
MIVEIISSVMCLFTQLFICGLCKIAFINSYYVGLHGRVISVQ